MVTKNPRINIVIDEGMYKEISKLAKKQGISLSLMARDLLKEAIDRYEDKYWNKIASERERKITSKRSLSHKDIWG